MLWSLPFGVCWVCDSDVDIASKSLLAVASGWHGVVRLGFVTVLIMLILVKSFEMKFGLQLVSVTTESFVFGSTILSRSCAMANCDITMIMFIYICICFIYNCACHMLVNNLHYRMCVSRNSVVICY